MNAAEISAFGAEFEKRSIAASTTLKVLRARMAQGARVAPAVLHHAEAAAGGASTPAALRRAALGASDSARAAKHVQAIQPLKKGFLGRIEKAEGLGAAQFDTSRSLRLNDALGHEHGYSQRALDTLSDAGDRLHDPKGLLRPKAPPVSSEVATRVSSRPKRSPV